MTQVAFQLRKSTRKMKIDSPIAVTFCVALALLGCAEAEDSAGDAGVIIGWFYDGEQGCLEQASPQVALADSLLLFDERAALGPGGVCWVLPRSQLPREGWTEIDPDQLPDSCPDLMGVPFCGPFCPNGRFSGSRYDEDRQCLLEREELWCKPIQYHDADVLNSALAPDGTCWLLQGNQMPAEDWTDLHENPSDACPNSYDGVVRCSADGEVDSGLSDSGADFTDASVEGEDAATLADAAVVDSALSDAHAAHD